MALVGHRIVLVKINVMQSFFWRGSHIKPQNVLELISNCVNFFLELLSMPT